MRPSVDLRINGRRTAYEAPRALSDCARRLASPESETRYRGAHLYV